MSESPSKYMFQKGGMIERYTDHAANERTFLAWVRTALAIVAFGCVLARFDVFLRSVVLDHPAMAHASQGPTARIGIAAVIGGLALLPVCWWRYRSVYLALMDDRPRAVARPGLEFCVVAVLFLLGLAVLAALLGVPV